MDKNRILELAIESLERQKAKIDTEIENLRSEIKGRKTTPIKKRTSAKPAKKRGKSAAERKALSEKMKKVWAARKSQKAKTKAVTKKPAKTKAGTKVRRKTAAEKKALSLKMKEVWKKRKAEAAQKAKA